MPKTFTLNVDYDLIKFEDGYEKPTKEVFYAKYNELLSNVYLDRLRSQRNEKLRQSDFSVLPDYPHPTEEVKQGWLDYRQSLRDLPSTQSITLDENNIPNEIVWPTPPT